MTLEDHRSVAAMIALLKDSQAAVEAKIGGATDKSATSALLIVGALGRLSDSLVAAPDQSSEEALSGIAKAWASVFIATLHYASRSRMKASLCFEAVAKISMASYAIGDAIIAAGEVVSGANQMMPDTVALGRLLVSMFEIGARVGIDPPQAFRSVWESSPEWERYCLSTPTE